MMGCRYFDADTYEPLSIGQVRERIWVGGRETGISDPDIQKCADNDSTWDADFLEMFNVEMREE